MEASTLQTLFIVLPVAALVAVILLLIFGRSTDTVTFNIELTDQEEDIPQVPEPEPVVAPKRKYKKRVKKASAPAAEITPAIKKTVGRPKKSK
jgi:hypothetical protein